MYLYHAHYILLINTYGYQLIFYSVRKLFTGFEIAAFNT